MGTTELEYFARCASGFEQVLAQELKDLGLRRVRPLRGGVAFFGDKRAGYRACLWSRVATRIQLVLTRIGAKDAEELYRNAYAFAWEEHLPARATIAVQAHGTNQNLRKTTFTALKVKDALCDRMRDVRNSRPNVDAKHPDFSINIALHQQRATLYLNLSGESLHRRGYREDGVQTEAPLKETLAAGMLLMAGWPTMAQQGGGLVDPMCGSGTIAIEAALMTYHIAPGLLRNEWGFIGWAQHDEGLWRSVFDEAQSRKDYSVGRPRIVANDVDEQALAIAKKNAERAGVLDMIQFCTGDAANLAKRIRHITNNPSASLIATNPPYGKRLLAQEDLPQAYAALSAVVEALPSNGEVVLITPDPGIDSVLGRTPHQTLSCYNGPIEASIRRYRLDVPRLTHDVVALNGAQHAVPMADPNSAQFAARFRKVARERARWARKNNIDCYRIYDGDLPDYAFSIDLYQNAHEKGEGGFVHIVEMRKPSANDRERMAQHLMDARSFVAAILGVNSNEIIVVPANTDDTQRGTRDKHLIVATEDSLAFEIDLARSCVFALPLAERSMRRWVEDNASGKRVVGLFATSGSALLHAAAGGAATTIAVDASCEHLKSLERTFAKNGYATSGYRFARSSVRQWIDREMSRKHTYDLIICTPPEWLPAKDAGGTEWDARRDAVELLARARKILSKDGMIVCASSALQGLDGLSTQDVTERMTPDDFKRTKNKTYMWIIKVSNIR